MGVGCVRSSWQIYLHILQTSGKNIRQRSKKRGEVRKNILKGELPVSWREIHLTSGNRSIKAQGWSPAAPIPQKPEFVKAGGWARKRGTPQGSRNSWSRAEGRKGMNFFTALKLTSVWFSLWEGGQERGNFRKERAWYYFFWLLVSP